MSSDYEAATFLLEVLKQNVDRRSLRAPFFKAVAGIDRELRARPRAAGRGEEAGVSDDTMLAVLEAAQTWAATSCRRSCSPWPRTRTLTGSLREAYLDAADKLVGLRAERRC